MKRFASLYKNLEQSASETDKVATLADYFTHARNEDKLWAISLLSGRRPKRLCTLKDLQSWALETSQLPNWLFAASQKVINDVAEAAALLQPDTSGHTDTPLADWMDFINRLRLVKSSDKKQAIQAAWQQLNAESRFVLNKIITSGLQLNIREQTLTSGISRASNTKEYIISHRLSGHWSPEINDYDELFIAAKTKDHIARPYPLAPDKPFPEDAYDKINTLHWWVNYCWEGLPVQLILRKGELFLWAKNEKLLNAYFPEIDILKHFLPDGTVLTGQLIAYDNKPLPYYRLLPRLKAKKPGQKKQLSAPVVMLVYDLLEFGGEDVRQWPLKKRRTVLAGLLNQNNTNNVLRLIENLNVDDGKILNDLRQLTREEKAVGLLLKSKNSVYQDGAFLLKPEPYLVKGVLVYAELNRRSGRVSILSLAVREGEKLWPFVKVDADLSNEDQVALMQFIKAHTLARFGASRSIEPELIFEIEFENIHGSIRHKSGLTLRAPKLKFWRKDLTTEDADTLQDLHKLI